VDCREFRDLLRLLRSDLKEEDIPKKTKLRDEILMEWVKWFHRFKQELHASIFSYEFVTATNLKSGTV